MILDSELGLVSVKVQKTSVRSSAVLPMNTDNSAALQPISRTFFPRNQLGSKNSSRRSTLLARSLTAVESLSLFLLSLLDRSLLEALGGRRTDNPRLEEWWGLGYCSSCLHLGGFACCCRAGALLFDAAVLAMTEDAESSLPFAFGFVCS